MEDAWYKSESAYHLLLSDGLGECKFWTRRGSLLRGTPDKTVESTGYRDIDLAT